jgi:hypothetical protein
VLKEQSLKNLVRRSAALTAGLTVSFGWVAPAADAAPPAVPVSRPAAAGLTLPQLPRDWQARREAVAARDRFRPLTGD